LTARIILQVRKEIRGVHLRVCICRPFTKEIEDSGGKVKTVLTLSLKAGDTEEQRK
jgi:hypothetical protein